jgi:hypothetical protein
MQANPEVGLQYPGLAFVFTLIAIVLAIYFMTYIFIYLILKPNKKLIKSVFLQLYYFLRYQYAWLITSLLGNWRWITFFCYGVKTPKRRNICFMWGRHNSPEPIRCDRCGWAGMVRWLIHTYQDDGTGEDVEPVDECPKCGEFL